MYVISANSSFSHVSLQGTWTQLAGHVDQLNPVKMSITEATMFNVINVKLARFDMGMDHFIGDVDDMLELCRVRLSFIFIGYILQIRGEYYSMTPTMYA